LDPRFLLLGVGSRQYYFVPVTDKIGVDVIVKWYLANDTLVGKKRYDYTAISDYPCNMRACQILDDGGIGAYIWIG
jgi:hypothetical protein